MWNYRIVKHEYHDGVILYRIYKVFYNEKGKVEKWTRAVVCSYGESLEELKNDFELYRYAFSKAILDYETGEKVQNE